MSFGFWGLCTKSEVHQSLLGVSTLQKLVSEAVGRAGSCKPAPIVNPHTGVSVCALGSVCPENLDSNLVLAQYFNVCEKRFSVRTHEYIWI